MTFIACAAMLASAVAFTGCKGDQNAPQQQNAPAVKTEFSIALPNQLSNGARRMPSGTVQKKGMEEFNGLTGIVLIPFAKQGAIDASSDTRLGAQNITLVDLNKSEVQSKTNQAKVYENVSIPLTTSSFLFYAQSKATSNPDEPETMFRAGALVATTSGNPTVWATDEPTNLKFNLKSIAPSYGNSLLAAGNGGKLLQYLTNIACASDGETTPKKWYEYTSADDAAIKAMFDTYTLIQAAPNGATGLKYLSSFGVSRVLTDLYKSLKPLTSPIAVGIKGAINDATYIDQTELANNDTVVLIAALRNYPNEINLPDGAISIKWDGSQHKFVEGDYPNMTRPQNFTYPAQLWYYVNSQIKTSNTSKKTMYENTSNSWQNILDAHEAAISVNTLTRAVAIEKPIQYAVGRLDVTVKLANASMADNSESATGIATAVDVSAGFPVSAIFVGGQQQVNYDFTCSQTSSDPEYTIYDRSLAKSGWVATTSAPVLTGDNPEINHTLVLENREADVRIAVELTNTGKDFYGYDNQLIPHGGKFYVCAQLEHSQATQTGGRVFKQDYTTTANLTLPNLQKAYSTLPDLRTPQLELGFSVDLTWQDGHVYNIEFE